MNVFDFAKEYQEKPIEWGVDDCTAWAARWVSLVSGINFDIPKYSTKEQADALVAASGGLLHLISEHLGPPSNASDFDFPSVGDIAVVKMSRYPEVTVIMLDNCSAMWRADSGVRVFFARPKLIRGFWRIDPVA